MMKVMLLKLRVSMRVVNLCGVLLWLSLSSQLFAQVTPDSGAGLEGAWRARVSEESDQYIHRLQGERLSARTPLVEARWNSGQTAVWPAGPGILGAQDPALFPSTLNAVLRTYGLPEGLAAVAAVESGFNPYALSPKGARGLWQFMPDTARRFGLLVDANHDERLDPLKSTLAAAQYLRQLYAQFGNWPLALAAYNTGEDRVQKTIERMHTRDFWSLSRGPAFSEETRRYVPAVLALAGTDLFSRDIATAQGGRPQTVSKIFSNGTSISTRVVFAESSPRHSVLAPAN